MSWFGVIFSVIAFFAGFIIAQRRMSKEIGSLKDIKGKFSQWYSKLDVVKDELEKTTQKKVVLDSNVQQKQKLLEQLNTQTADLQKMEAQRQTIEQSFSELPSKRKAIEDLEETIEELKSELSLYTDMESYVDYGFYPLPTYGETTSGAYNEQLKSVRQEQKQMLRDATAYTAPYDIEITGNAAHDKKLLKNQGHLLISVFNSECDYLISKVSSKNYEATITRIEKLAENLEKRLISLEIGINLNYVELKMQECAVYYQYICQKTAEAEEQREIRAQIREEAAAEREIEKAIRDSEKEEDMLQQAMTKARKEMAYASAEQKLRYEFQLEELTERLAQAEFRRERALSMAQQTKRGFVYVISNIGSFGEDIYKIGMTRRLEPLDRVKELSSASVPFAFDVHAMIYSEDAPALEKRLHNHFDLASVNKVNSRKEFFEITLSEIRDYVEDAGLKTRWTMAADATEYRQSLAILEEQMELSA